MTEEDSSVWRVNGRSVRVTDQVNLLWPDEGLTNGDLYGYLQAIAPTMLPHLARRPLTLRCFPEGAGGPSFYRRDLPDDAPDWVQRVTYVPAATGRAIRLPLADEAADLVWLAGKGCLELHAWNSCAPALNEPDQAVFDLDPGDAATFDQVREAALRLRHLLQAAALDGFAKTSGRRGMHVHVSLAPGHRYEAVRAWVKSVAEALARQSPKLVRVASGATHRGSLVSIDYAQNSIARTMAAPYGVRAVPGALVAAPVTWDEIADGHLHPADLTMRTLPSRVDAIGDVFAPMLRHEIVLPDRHGP